jgi:hypothetical protein
VFSDLQTFIFIFAIIKTFKTAAILFIDSVTDDCRYFPISGQFIPDTRNHQQGKMHKMSIKPMDFRHADRDAVNKKNSGSFEGLYRNHLYDSSITGRTAKQ